MSSFTAWKLCTVGTGETSVGTRAWSSPTKIIALDGDYSSSDPVLSDEQTNYLIGSTFAFTNADFGGRTGCSIINIYFRLTRMSNNGTSTDTLFKLIQAAAIAGSSLSLGATWPNGAPATYVFSGLGGLSWLQSDIVGVAGFGGAISANTGGAGILYVDGMECRIEFDPPLDGGSALLRTGVS